MNKKHIDEFYNKVENDCEYEIFSLSLPLLLLNKYLHNVSENFYKTKYDLIHSDIDVLAALYFTNDNHSLTPTELYDATVFSSGGMTKVLKKLEKRELIFREASKEDKRKFIIKLTKNGEDLINECMNLIKGCLEEFFSPLSKKEQKEMKTMFSKLLYSVTQSSISSKIGQ